MTAPVHRNALPAGATLQEYRIDRLLGAGGFGITYLARDLNLDKPVALKEYLPSELATRGGDGAVAPLSTQREDDYRWGLERFLQEARTLAKFDHPNIVRVLRYFEANATAYMVMEYERGEPLKTLLAKAPPTEAILRKILDPILDGLAAVHAAGFLHRDIKPDNILVRPDGSPVLIDFGAARNALGAETRALTAILTPGFAPLEQYSGDKRQGPWTDLYALGGVLFNAVAGRKPPDAVARMREDPVPGLLAQARGRFSADFLQSVEWALALDEAKRPQSIAQWRSGLKPHEKTVRLEPPGKRTLRWPYLVGAVLLLALAGGLLLKKKHPAASLAGDSFRQEVEAEFRRADANGDGFLSQEEVRAHFPFIAREFGRVDRDGDGRISAAEFENVRRLQAERRGQRKSD